MVKAIITAAIASAALVGCATPYQVMADREVDRLCAIDGGTVVYEKVQLSPENYGPNGKLFPQYRVPGNFASFGPDFEGIVTNTIVENGSASIHKITAEIRRTKDRKVLGRKITYRRQGGDAAIFSGLHETSYSCPAYGVAPDLESAVFGKGGPL